MRKIALIMDGWKRYFTYAWPAGILQRIRETNEEVNLYIFNSFGNWSRDREYSYGEYNIFNLPDFSDFDGIILDLNNTSSREVLKSVMDKTKKAGKPVVSLANELEDFYYAGIDNMAAMRKTIAHMHEKHGCSRFWFVMGPVENFESDRRTRAVKKYMEEKGIPYSEEDFFFGEFDYSTGMEGFVTLLARHGKLPEAVICASDNMAVGVCEAANQQGYRIPQDFRLSGFDNFDKAGFYHPSITTIGHIREEAGYMAADILLRVWAGEKLPRFHYTEAQLLCQESCGCKQGSVRNLREHLKNQIMYGIESSEFDAEVLSLESEMMQCNTVEEMMYCISGCIPALKCDAMYLVLDDHINAYKEKADEYRWSLRKTDEGFSRTGYSDNMQIRFAYEKGKNPDLPHTRIHGIFPAFDFGEGGKDFLFLPLHFREWTVGYFVIRNAVYLMEKQYLFQVINVLTRSMENLHKKEQLEDMNRKLSKLYLMDPLTGMYNRMGNQKLGKNYFQAMHARFQPIVICFMDLDHLKYINDNYGHEYGDCAICATARAIMKYCGRDAVPARMGGDEFVLVQAYESEEAVRKQLFDIGRELKQEAERLKLPFPLDISVGNVVTDPEKDLSFDAYVKIADERMYQDKLAKKAERKN